MSCFRVRLSKRRKTGGAQMAKSRLIVKHREVNEREVAAQVNISLSVMRKHLRSTFVICEMSDMHSINVDTS